MAPWFTVGPVNSATTYWALPNDELLKLLGYCVDDAGRAADIAEARQRYEAAGKADIRQIWVRGRPRLHQPVPASGIWPDPET